MKKSNKVSIVYIITSISLLLVLIFGGAYGVYISVGLNFVKSSISNVAGSTGASNVAFSDNLAGYNDTSMTGVIVISVVLIVLSILDFICLIKQVVFFKQFKVVQNSTMEKAIEKKSKSKGKVVFFACLIDILSLIAGAFGLFLNSRTFVGNNIAWVLYAVDGAVCILALVSFVLLLVKLRKAKSSIEKFENDYNCSKKEKCSKLQFIESHNEIASNIDKVEYYLLKLKHLKASKILSQEEYLFLRNMLFGFNEKDDDEFLTDKENKAD